MKNTSYLFHNYKIPESLASFGEFAISLAELNDSVGCYLLNSQLGYETDEQTFAKRFLFLSNHPEHSVIVVRNSNEEVIAWMHMGLRFLLEAEHFAQLAGVVVREQERSSGVGAHLLKVAEDWSRHHGMKKICLSSSVTRERAHSFYLKNGYEHSKTSKLFSKALE